MSLLMRSFWNGKVEVGTGHNVNKGKPPQCFLNCFHKQ